MKSKRSYEHLKGALKSIQLQVHMFGLVNGGISLSWPGNVDHTGSWPWQWSTTIFNWPIWVQKYNVRLCVPLLWGKNTKPVYYNLHFFNIGSCRFEPKVRKQCFVYCQNRQNTIWVIWKELNLQSTSIRQNMKGYPTKLLSYKNLLPPHKPYITKLHTFLSSDSSKCLKHFVG